MEEKARFADELMRAAKGEGLPGDVVSFALFGDEAYTRTVGANRNALLLAAPGELCVMIDDDTVSRTAVLEETDAHLALSALKDPTVSRFYADRKQLEDSVRPVDVDILSCHEKMLGRSIAGCVSCLGPDSELDVDRLAPESVLFFGSGSKVVKATATGFWGDSGMDFAPPGPGADGRIPGPGHAVEETVRPSQGKPGDLSRRAPLHDRRRRRVHAHERRGRQPLAAALPSGGHSDGIFAMTLRVCAEEALIGHVPFAVLHAPLETRHYAQNAAIAAGGAAARPAAVYFVVRLNTPSQLEAGGFASNSWHDLM